MTTAQTILLQWYKNQSHDVKWTIRKAFMEKVKMINEGPNNTIKPTSTGFVKTQRQYEGFEL